MEEQVSNELIWVCMDTEGRPTACLRGVHDYHRPPVNTRGIHVNLGAASRSVLFPKDQLSLFRFNEIRTAEILPEGNSTDKKIGCSLICHFKEPVKLQEVENPGLPFSNFKFVPDTEGQTVCKLVLMADGEFQISVH